MWTNRLVLASASVLLAAACSDDSSENASGTATGTVGPTADGGTMETSGSGTTGTTTAATSATGAMTVTTTGSTTGAGTTGSGTTGAGTTGAGTTGAGTTGSGTSGTGGTGATTTGSSTDGTGATGGVGGTECPYTPPELPDTFPMGWTSDDVIVFNDNGGWTWYNDERVVVDAAAGKIVVGSASSSASSQTADPSIKVVIHDLATGMNEEASLGSLSYSDDHNNPGLVVKAPGEYFAAYAHHNKDCDTHWANYSGSWSPTTTYAWGSQGCPWTSNQGGTSYVTYNNVWQLSAEGRIYNFIRSVQTSPTFLYSEDNGQSWTWGGRLTSSQQIGYNAGYYKYWGNGVDRIDFFATESHPRDSNTSIYHGYIQDGKTYDSYGEEQDDNLFDSDSPTIQQFTRVFQAGNMLDGVPMNRLWNFDVARYADGTIAVLWQGREQSNAQKPSNPSWDPGHHVAYSRFDGTEWKSTRLVRGGRTLYRQLAGDWWEEDYIGGAALDPDDPHVVYVSTNIDPRDESTEYPWNEIWKGVTCDDGATFTWTPMTMNSLAENLRPVVPKWDTKNTAVLWFRGVYNTAQSFGTEVVGIVTRGE